ncbi:hypothetical protein [Arsenicicoccus sp. oral taxon 190]|uniref:hypothetical protein n=1 Tax=Arsenicicoccus sp. oral taxon 190 TaxID=1658671 RepID=UPI0012E0F1EE|nr:hypothetical protein [Arsenicicoccus sp. oral taxon 190]
MVEDLEALVAEAGPVVWRCATAVLPPEVATDATADVLARLARGPRLPDEQQVRATTTRLLARWCRDEDLPVPGADELRTIWAQARTRAVDGSCPVTPDHLRDRMSAARRQRWLALGAVTVVLAGAGWLAVDGVARIQGTPAPSPTDSSTSAPSTGAAPTPSESLGPDGQVDVGRAYRAALDTAAGRATSVLPRLEQAGRRVRLVRASGTAMLGALGPFGPAQTGVMPLGPDGGVVLLIEPGSADQPGGLAPQIWWWRGESPPGRVRSGDVLGLAGSPDGSRLAFVDAPSGPEGAGQGLRLRVIDTGSGREVAQQGVPGGTSVVAWVTTGVLLVTPLPESTTPTTGADGSVTVDHSQSRQRHLLWQPGRAPQPVDVPVTTALAADLYDPGHLLRADAGDQCLHRVPVSDLGRRGRECAEQVQVTSPDGSRVVQPGPLPSIRDVKTGAVTTYRGDNLALRSPTATILAWEDDQRVLVQVTSEQTERSPVLLRWDTTSDTVERVPGPVLAVDPRQHRAG